MDKNGARAKTSVQHDKVDNVHEFAVLISLLALLLETLKNMFSTVY